MMSLLARMSKGQCSENDIINLKKIAIVFGERDYKNGPLINPINDAKDMSDSLKKMGFDVYTYYNTDYKTMKDAIEEWYTKIPKYDVALFYYSGHGAEVNGKNYLFPIDAAVRSISDLEYVAYSANRVLSNMEVSNSKFNIMILDACRDNPFTKSLTRDIKSGLASMTGKGSFVGFAASPGTVASDGDKRNGTYTEAILKYISVPNLTIDQIFTKVNSHVRSRTSDMQIPYKNSSLSSDFCFSVRNEKPSRISTKSVVVQPSSGILLALTEERIITSDSLNNGLLFKDSKTLNTINMVKIENLHPYKITVRGGENIYVIDTTARTLSIINLKEKILKSTLNLQDQPLSIVISIDERKAYISNQLVSTDGSISVVDLLQNKIIKKISNGNHFLGLAISSNGKYIYATSQCRLEKNIMHVIDVKTDKIIKSIEGLSCGEAIGLLPDNNKIYVSNVGEGGLNQINIINTNSLKIVKTLDIKSRFFAFSSDNKYIFSLGESDVTVIRAEDDVVINKLPFATPPQGIAVSEDEKIFVWLPKEYRTKVFSIAESLQNVAPDDPEINLKNFKEEIKKKANTDIHYRLGELFTKANMTFFSGPYNLSQELGDSYQYSMANDTYNYKEGVFSCQYSIAFKLDNSKNINPLCQAKFTENLLLISMKERGQEEIFKTSVDNIDWDKVKKFVREFFLKRISQLR